MLSIVMPGIRTHLWERLYSSIENSLENKFELIIVSPFDLPDSLKGKDNIQYIQSYAKVPVCLQLGTLAAKYDLFCHAVDDSIFLKGTLKNAVSLIENKTDIVGLTYIENTNHMIGSERWAVRNLPEFHLPLIDKDWYTFVQPLMSKEMFLSVGGIRCSFEYSNHSHHDLAFRLQMVGGKIIIPTFPVSIAEHMPERTGDHGPIHDAQMSDIEKFNQLYSESSIIPVIDINNHLSESQIWQRRFKNTYTTYKELSENEGYRI